MYEVHGSDATDLHALYEQFLNGILRISHVIHDRCWDTCATVTVGLQFALQSNDLKVFQRCTNKNRCKIAVLFWFVCFLPTHLETKRQPVADIIMPTRGRSARAISCNEPLVKLYAHGIYASGFRSGPKFAAARARALRP